MSAIPSRLWLTVDEVVQTALRDLDRGRTVSVAGPQYKAIVGATKLLPTAARRRASALARRRLT